MKRIPPRRSPSLGRLPRKGNDGRWTETGGDRLHVDDGLLLLEEIEEDGIRGEIGAEEEEGDSTTDGGDLPTNADGHRIEETGGEILDGIETIGRLKESRRVQKERDETIKEGNTA